MRFLDRLKRKVGQHTLEYVIMMTLVMAGILMAGPYVIRSWNANLKGWEDSAIDSIQDPFLPATLDFDFDSCVALPEESQDCGEGIIVCGTRDINCVDTKRLYTQPYTPNHCQCSPENIDVLSLGRCAADACCCSDPVPTGRCGSDAGFVNGELPKPDCNNKMLPRNSDGTCPEGTMEGHYDCGDPVTDGVTGPHYGCMAEMPDGTDPTPGNGIYDDCTVYCKSWHDPAFSDPIGTVPPGYGEVCPGDDVGLTEITDDSFVATGEGSENCTDAKCERHCAEDYFPAGTGKYAHCTTCETEGFDVTGCGENEYNLDGCPVGQFKPCCLSACKSLSWTHIETWEGTDFEETFDPSLCASAPTFSMPAFVSYDDGIATDADGGKWVFGILGGKFCSDYGAGAMVRAIGEQYFVGDGPNPLIPNPWSSCYVCTWGDRCSFIQPDPLTGLPLSGCKGPDENSAWERSIFMGVDLTSMSYNGDVVTCIPLPNNSDTSCSDDLFIYETTDLPADCDFFTPGNPCGPLPGQTVGTYRTEICRYTKEGHNPQPW